jgi:amidase
VPCGFTRQGLPVGLQIIGPHRGEAKLFGVGRLIEETSGIAGRVPIDPRGPAVLSTTPPPLRAAS